MIGINRNVGGARQCIEALHDTRLAGVGHGLRVAGRTCGRDCRGWCLLYLCRQGKWCLWNRRRSGRYPLHLWWRRRPGRGRCCRPVQGWRSIGCRGWQDRIRIRGKFAIGNRGGAGRQGIGQRQGFLRLRQSPGQRRCGLCKRGFMGTRLLGTCLQNWFAVHPDDRFCNFRRPGPGDSLVPAACLHGNGGRRQCKGNKN